MRYHLANGSDLALLAEWNLQLIQDEGHRNPMTVAELKERMRGWLADEYRAVVFERGEKPVAYALFREAESEICLRQLFVSRDHRRQGVGRGAVAILRNRVWPPTKRLTVEVLTGNAAAAAFWRSVGFRDYSLMLEILPVAGGDRQVAQGRR